MALGLGHEAAPRNSPVRGTFPGNGPYGCTIATGSSCVVALVGSGWTVDPLSSWCTYNASTVSVSGPNGTSNQTSVTSTCQPSVGYLDFNMTTNGILAGALSAPGPFAVWLVPAWDTCFTIYYSIANIPVPCPPPAESTPSFEWNRSISTAGSIDLGNVTSGPGVLPGASWEILLVDTGATAETITVSASVVLAPA